jgi:multidrug efflux pump subunit AcrA (membrane-fusion protein)
MRFGPKALLPAAVLVGALAFSAALVVARPVPEAQSIAAARPVVAVVAVAPRPERMRVRTQGTLEPRTELELVAEVGGRLVWASPALEAGSFFTAGEVLARIEPADYEIARARGGGRAPPSSARGASAS